jgi:hypothetical protein
MSQINKLADFKKNCDEKSLNYESLEKALKDCQTSKQASPSWYGTTYGVIGIGILSFLVGMGVK